MRCEKCGVELESNSTFCNNCGATVRQTNNINQNININQGINNVNNSLNNNQNTMPINNSNKNNKLMYILIGIGALLVIIIIAIVLLTGNKEVKNNENNTEVSNNDSNISNNNYSNTNTNQNSTSKGKNKIGKLTFTYDDSKWKTDDTNSDTIWGIESNDRRKRLTVYHFSVELSIDESIESQLKVADLFDGKEEKREDVTINGDKWKKLVVNYDEYTTSYYYNNKDNESYEVEYTIYGKDTDDSELKEIIDSLKFEQ